MAMTSHLVDHRVSVADVLGYFSSNTQVASAFGAQLSAARDGVEAARDAMKTQARIEATMLRRSQVIRCVDALGLQERFATVPVSKLGRMALKSGRSQGWVVCRVLEAYEPWSTNSSITALLSVYRWAQTVLELPELSTKGETSVAQAARVGKLGKWSSLPSELVADSTLALGYWVDRWNRPR